jgi:hypothetical protein
MRQPRLDRLILDAANGCTVASGLFWRTNSVAGAFRPR